MNETLYRQQLDIIEAMLAKEEDYDDRIKAVNALTLARIARTLDSIEVRLSDIADAQWRAHPV